ncbi:MAG: phosphatidylglycerophosphatase A [Hydrogenophilaceae bacterium]|nr:phosphatidylglycerophosphatase A [Hydrogenophilaceae bacterium]
MKPDWKFAISHPAHFIALGFGSGLAPKAPGTIGSLAALPLFWLIAQAIDNAALLAAFLTFSFLAGIWACAITGKNLGVADHGGIVWDEIVAMWLILAVVPFGWAEWLAAFALFRFFDILKPWPIRQLDARLKNGLGVMLDDVLAAIYALAIFKALQWLA